MTLPTVTLDDKYTVESGRIYLTGIQALVRLPLMQKKRDEAAGLNTAGFISGYRGSPLGALDLQLWRAQKYLDQHDIQFKPGINEELAMTAVWGSQQVNLWPSAKYDGVFSMWYGKGRALTAAATPCVTATWPVRRSMAAYWFWPATTTGPSHRPYRHSPTTPSWTRWSRS